jgi:CRP-like cAMP-binding protein
MTVLASPLPTTERLWHEKKIDILNQLTPAELIILQRASSRLFKTRGEMLWRDDEWRDRQNVYIVDQGFLRICQSNPEGKRHILAMLGPADFFGHIAPGVSTLTRPYTFEVVRDVRLIVIDALAFQSVLKNHFNLAMQLIKLMDERQKQLERRISGFFFKDVYTRLADLLLELTEKYGEPSLENGQWELQITHQELSDFLGVARQTVSTIMSEFSTLGILTKRGQRLCVNPQALLEAIANRSDVESKEE